MIFRAALSLGKWMSKPARYLWDSEVLSFKSGNVEQIVKFAIVFFLSILRQKH